MKAPDLADYARPNRPLPFRFVYLRATIRRERETKRRLTPPRMRNNERNC
jgi:hypothetical protein